MAYNPQNPNGQATMANSAPVVIASDQSTVPVNITQSDTFGQIISAVRYNQVEVDFSSIAPGSITDITVTNTSGGSSSNSDGQGVFTSGTNTNGGVKAVSNISVDYRPNAETYASFSVIFTTGIASSYQRIGIYNTTDGFFIGYEGISFGVTIRKNGVADNFIPRASWNVDTLNGATTSKYTLNGTPMTYDPTKDNLFRIRFGWLGAASVTFEIYSPDGVWVPFHIYKIANVQTSPTVNNPNLPVTLDIKKTAAGAGILTMSTACWGAGTTSGYNKITATLTDNTLAQLGRSVITGQTTGGGGGYVNVKVNPSGAMVTATTLDAGTATIGVLGANSGVDIGDVTINNGAGVSAVNIQDGGNSITVDGTVAATQSGTWNVGQLALTSGGVVPASGASVGGATAVTLYSSPGQVYGWYFYNPNGSAAYIHFYDTGSTPTVGTTTAYYVLVIPPTAGANVFGIGITHTNSIKIGISQGRSSGTAMASAVDYTIFYK